jgi:hypothetical protein
MVRRMIVWTRARVWMVAGMVGLLTRPNSVSFSRKGNARDTHAPHELNILDEEIPPCLPRRIMPKP